MAGFGTRGGLRQVGVVRADPPGQQPIIAPLGKYQGLHEKTQEQAPTTTKPKS